MGQQCSLRISGGTRGVRDGKRRTLVHADERIRGARIGQERLAPDQAFDVAHLALPAQDEAGVLVPNGEPDLLAGPTPDQRLRPEPDWLDQEATVGGETIAFAEGEPIVTEHCHKYTLEQMEALAGEVGLRIATHWSDPKDWFSVAYLVP